MALQLIFFKVFETSISASVIVFIILLLRKFTLRMSTQKLIYCLWLLFIIKLILPISIPSPLSIENITDKYIYGNSPNLFDIGITSAADGLVKIQKTVGLYKNDSPIKKEMQSYKFGQSIKETNFITDKATIESSRYVSSMNIFLFGSSLFWFIGFIIHLAWIISKNIKFKRLFIKNIYCKDDEIINIFMQCKKEIGIKKNINLYISGMTVPSIYGIFKPSILLPYDCKEFYNAEELRYILLHELSHYKQKDLLLLSFKNLIKALHWFNPLIRIGINKMEDDCELLCDLRVMNKLKAKERLNYGLLLIKQSELNVSNFNHNIFSASLFWKTSQLQIRVKKIVGHKNKKLDKVAFMATTFTLLIMLFILVPINNSYALKKNYIKQQPTLYVFWIKDNINPADIKNINNMVSQMMGSPAENQDMLLIYTGTVHPEYKYKLLLEETWPFSIFYSNNPIEISTKNLQKEAQKRDIKQGSFYVFFQCDFTYTKYMSSSIGKHTLLDLNSLYTLDKIEIN